MGRAGTGVPCIGASVFGPKAWWRRLTPKRVRGCLEFLWALALEQRKDLYFFNTTRHNAQRAVQLQIGTNMATCQQIGHFQVYPGHDTVWDCQPGLPPQTDPWHEPPHPWPFGRQSWLLVRCVGRVWDSSLGLEGAVVHLSNTLTTHPLESVTMRDQSRKITHGFFNSFH